jgi:hypothetical protein
VRQVDQRPLGIAEDQHVGLGIGQDGTAHLVRPVVVVGDAAQRRFDAADDDGHVGIGFAARWAYTVTARSGRLFGSALAV